MLSNSHQTLININSDHLGDQIEVNTLCFLLTSEQEPMTLLLQTYYKNINS